MLGHWAYPLLPRLPRLRRFPALPSQLSFTALLSVFLTVFPTCFQPFHGLQASLLPVFFTIFWLASSPSMAFRLLLQRCHLDVETC